MFQWKPTLLKTCDSSHVHWVVYVFPPPQVCELDLIFNFEKAYYILDEFLMAGEVVETSKVAVGASIEEADELQEVQ